MSNTIKDRPLVRLDSLPLGGSRLTVERTFAGKIRNVSIETTGPALGHGFTIDKTTVEQVARHAAGMRGRCTHGGLCDDGLGRHLGTCLDLNSGPFLRRRPVGRLGCGQEKILVGHHESRRLSEPDRSPSSCLPNAGVLNVCV